MPKNLGFLCRRGGRLGVLLMILMAAPALAGQVELISRIDSSQTADSGAGPYHQGAPSGPLPSLSADGRYVAFVSPNPNLVPGQRDINGDGQLVAMDVFVRDLVAGTTTLVSHVSGSETTAGNDGSGLDGAVLSADGRWVAFTSQATDLVSGQPVSSFGNVYLFLYDQMAKTMVLAAATGDRDNHFWNLAVSADGRYLTFTSDASGLIPGQPVDFNFHVFLFDRTTRRLQLADHKRGLPNLPGNQGGSSQGISADGRYVLFVSGSGGLVSGQKPDDGLFLYDRTTGLNVAVGPAEGRTLLSADGRYVAAYFGTPYTWDRQTGVRTPFSGITAGSVIELDGISADGRYVLGQRADGDNNLTPVLYDRVARTYTQTARSPAAFNRIAQLSLSGDGRYVVFLDPETDVLPGESNPNRLWNVFLFDRTTQTTSLVSHATASPLTSGSASSYSPAISANGSRIVFSSEATDLVPGARDLNDGLDLFSYQVATGATDLVTRRASSLPSLAPEGASTARAVSADGRWVVYESDAAHLIAGQADTNGRKDVFLYDRTTRQTVLVSHSAASAVTAGNGASLQPSLSADGRYVSFLSSADDLAAGATPQAGYYNVYVYDRTTGATRFVARTIGAGVSDETQIGEQRISADGNWVAFTSTADDLVPGQHPGTFSFNVFLWSRETGSRTLVSRSSLHTDPWPGHGKSTSPRLSADGRYVAFQSAADDLVPGQTVEPSPFDPFTNIFLYDRVTGGTVLVSHGRASATAGAAVSSFPSISADGRLVAFASREGNLAPDVDGGDQSTYLYDRTLGTNRWIAGSARGDVPRISADGGTVAFISDLPLLPGVEPDTLQLYLYSVAAKTLTLATRSRLPGRTGSDGDLSSAYDVSADGRYVAFSTDAHDLVPGEIPPPPSVPGSLARDLYLFDRSTGATVLISRSRSSAVAATGLARFPMLSADGHKVAFTSDSALADGDFNRRSDAYLFDLDAAGSGGGGPVTVPPCALFDGSLRSNLQKVLAVAGSCGVPTGAHQVAVKVTARQGSAQGNLRLFPGDATGAAAPSGTLRFQKGQTAVLSLDLPLAANGAGTIAVLPFVRGNGTVRVTVEVDGYTP